LDSTHESNIEKLEELYHVAKAFAAKQETPMVITVYYSGHGYLVMDVNEK